MKKRISGKKLNRNTNERKRLYRNLVRSLIEKDAIVTSLAKAKAVRPIVDKLVTRAKENSLTNFRLVIKDIAHVPTARKLMHVGAFFSSRSGGYTRIIRLGNQTGDNTPIVRLEWVETIPVIEVIKKTREKKVQEKKQVSQEKPKTPEEKPKTKQKSVKVKKESKKK